jgi:hypothetical protein
MKTDPRQETASAPPVGSSGLLGHWIHLAIAGGPHRKLIIAQDDGFEYLAILDFGDLRMRLGKHASTPDHAAMLLENELELKRDMWCYGHGPNSVIGQKSDNSHH